MNGKKLMLNFLGTLIAFCGMALIYMGAIASDSDVSLSIVLPMGIGGLIVFIFGILIARRYDNG
tara:strand:+ start:173 stop:364 length:192 start_codon:yes stop_codon:yes gene_type:complete